MNRTTPAQRAVWIARAAELIRRDPHNPWIVINRDEVLAALRSEFGISLQSARTANFHAVTRGNATLVRKGQQR